MSELTSVGAVAKQLRGVTYKKAEARQTPAAGYVPVLRANNIDGGRLVFDDLVYVPQDRVKPKQMLRVGDIVVAASSGSLSVVGKAAAVEQGWEGSFGAFCKVMRPDPSNVDPGYLAHYFQTAEYRRTVSDLAQGASINNLRNEHLDDLNLLVPDLEQQSEITKVLDHAEAACAKLRRALALLDALLAAVFDEMFGEGSRDNNRGRATNLGELVDLFAGNSLPDGVPFEGQKGGYLLLKVGDMNLPDNLPHITKAREWTDSLASGMLCPPGAIVLPKRGGSIATNKKGLLHRPALLDPNVMGISPHRGQALPIWLLHWFLRFDLVSISSGSSVPQLNKRDLDPLPITVPPLEEQERFAEVVRQSEPLRQRLIDQGARLDALYAALAARAFRGELALAPEPA